MKNKWLVKNRIEDSEFISVCQSSISMSQAAVKLGLHFNSFKKRALELGCYKPNQAGIGIRKNAPKIPLKEIVLQGLHPQYQSYKLKLRLIEEGFKTNQCEICGITKWQENTLNMELHHIDGNRSNHLINNLQLICPNCHSQTSNFRAKNKSI